MIHLKMPRTIHDLLVDNTQKWGQHNFVWTPIADTYESVSFAAIMQQAQAIASFLIAGGYKNTNVMIYSENSAEWMAIDLAVAGYIGISVGANKDWLEYDMSNAINATSPSVIFYSSSRAETINNLRRTFPNIAYICIDTEYESIIKKGTQNITAHTVTFENEAQPSSAICKIVFTSGTSSAPKAVTLTLENMWACGDYIYQRTPTNYHDSYYLFLPLHHVYAGVCIFMYALYMGCRVYLCGELSKIVDEMKQIQPTIFCGVPLVYEKFYSVIYTKNAKKLTKVLWISNNLFKLHIDVRKSLFKEIHTAFGGNVRFWYCGGAAFDPVVKKFFKDVGINIIEGYGMSETSGLISGEYPGSTNIRSTGKVFENTRVKIINADTDGYGEVAVKGDNVTHGYYNNPEANAKAFDADGYLRTGDIGYVDDNDNLYLKGRKKRQIVTSNGENVSIDELSALLCEYPEIVKAHIGQTNGAVSAVIYTQPQFESRIADIVNTLNATLPRYKQIRSYTIAKTDSNLRIK